MPLNQNYAGIDNINNYAGYTYDEVLELYFVQYRFYNAETRQFTQEDPIKDGSNWYAYCEGNPLVFLDPWGLKMYKVVDLFTNLLNALKNETYLGEVTSDVELINNNSVRFEIKNEYFDDLGFCVSFAGWSGGKKVAKNMEGHLYMEESTFYSLMGMDVFHAGVFYSVGINNIPFGEEGISLLVSAFGGYISAQDISKWGEQFADIVNFFIENKTEKSPDSILEVYTVGQIKLNGAPKIAGNYLAIEHKEEYYNISPEFWDNGQLIKKSETMVYLGDLTPRTNTFELVNVYGEKRGAYYYENIVNQQHLFKKIKEIKGMSV